MVWRNKFLLFIINTATIIINCNQVFVKKQTFMQEKTLRKKCPEQVELSARSSTFLYIRRQQPDKLTHTKQREQQRQENSMAMRKMELETNTV